MLKSKTLGERYTIAVDRATKDTLEQLKSVHRVNTGEWIRTLIRSELPKLKKQVGA